MVTKAGKHNRESGGNKPSAHQDETLPMAHGLVTVLILIFLLIVIHDFVD
jgi:hypothetical protein